MLAACACRVTWSLSRSSRAKLADRGVERSHRHLQRREMIKSIRFPDHEARCKALQVPAGFSRLKNDLHGRALNHASAACAAAHGAFPLQRARREPDRGSRHVAGLARPRFRQPFSLRTRPRDDALPSSVRKFLVDRFHGSSGTFRDPGVAERVWRRRPGSQGLRSRNRGGGAPEGSWRRTPGPPRGTAKRLREPEFASPCPGVSSLVPADISGRVPADAERVAAAGKGRWMAGEPKRETPDNRPLPEFDRLAWKPDGDAERTRQSPSGRVQGSQRKQGNRSLKRDPNYASLGRRLPRFTESRHVSDILGSQFSRPQCRHGRRA